MKFHDIVQVAGLTEQVSETLLSIRLLVRCSLLLFLLGLLCGGGLGSGWCSTGVCVWVGDAVFQLIYLWPAVLRSNSDSQDLLVAVDNGVHDGWQSWEVGSQRDACDCSNSTGESLEKLGLLNVENGWWEGVTLIIDLGDAHTVGEGRDVQHVEQGCLGGSDLGSGLNELQVGGDFNGTTSNLGWDTEGLEERGLSGLHTSVTGWDVDIIRSNGTSSGRSSDLVCQNLVTDGLEVTVGEDESDVTLDVWKKTLVLWGVCDEALHGTTNLRIVLVFAHLPYRSKLPYHSVLSHKDNTLTTEGLSNLVHLLGADIVDTNDEDRAVLFEEALELIEIAGLVC